MRSTNDLLYTEVLSEKNISYLYKIRNDIVEEKLIIDFWHDPFFTDPNFKLWRSQWLGLFLFNERGKKRKALGFASLHFPIWKGQEHIATLFVYVSPEYRSKGYGLYLAEQLLDYKFIQNHNKKTIKIKAYVPTTKDRAINFLFKLGFTIEGTLRYEFKPDDYADYYENVLELALFLKYGRAAKISADQEDIVEIFNEEFFEVNNEHKETDTNRNKI